MFDSEKIADWVEFIRPHLEYGMTHTSFALYAWAIKHHGTEPFSIREKTAIGSDIYPYMGKPQARAAVAKSVKKLLQIGYAKMERGMFRILDRPNRTRCVPEVRPVLVYREEKPAEVPQEIRKKRNKLIGGTCYDW